VAVFQRADTANNFHRIALERCFVYGLDCFIPTGKCPEYILWANSFNANDGPSQRLTQKPRKCPKSPILTVSAGSVVI
jgi:hypothetical protein